MGNMDAIIVRFSLVRADISLKYVIIAPSFPISTPVIPAKAGIQTANAVGTPASAICQHALVRADISLKTDDYRAPNPHFFALFAPSRLCVNFWALSYKGGVTAP